VLLLAEAIVRASGQALPSTSSQGAKMTIAYSTGWEHAYIHHQKADVSACPLWLMSVVLLLCFVRLLCLMMIFMQAHRRS
jgi:nitric oxide reductase large subunit